MVRSDLGVLMGEIIRRTKGARFIGWYLRYVDADGRRKQRASHQPTRALARRMLVEIEARIARGLVGVPAPPPPPLTVAELVTRFLAEYSRPQLKDLALYRARAGVALRRALPSLGSLRAAELRPSDLTRLRAALGRKCAEGSIVLTIAYLKTCLAWAVRERLVPAHPLRGRESATKAVATAAAFLSTEQVRLLLTAAEQRAAQGGLPARGLRAAVHFALHTGVRKGELCGLRWRDLDLDTRRLTIARSFKAVPKSGQPRHLRLPAAVIPILAQWQKECPRTAEGLVFPRRSRQGDWRMAHNATCMLGLPSLIAMAGLHPLARPWHTLRHTFASHYVMSGGNLLALQQVLGHADVKRTLIYAHLAPSFLAEEMDRIKF